MIASLSGHLPGGSPLPSWTNPKAPNFVSTSASHLLPSPICWPFSGQQLRATTRAMATWSLLRSSTSAILSTLKTIPCWFAFRLIIEEAFAPIQQLWPQARMWSDLRDWTPCRHHGSVIFFFNVRWKLLDTVLFRLGLKSSSNGCVIRQDVISASIVTKDNSIDHFRIVQKRKNKVETERTSFQFPLEGNENLSSQPRLCSFVLTLFESVLLAHGFHVGLIETMIAK